jgi:membrane-bound ClpP family serine protease
MEIFMKSFFRALSLTSVVCTISGSAMAVPRGAPGPEIGEGLVGAAIATVALLVFVLYPRLKRSRQSKEY